MATVALFPWPEAGHGSVFARLASLLEQRHRVVVCSHIDIAGFYRQRGMEFMGLRPDLLGEGTYQSTGTALTPFAKAGKKRAWNGFFKALHADSLPASLGFRPDLALVDVAWPYLSMLALRDAIPVAGLSTALPLDWDPAVPPASTTMKPHRGLAAALVRKAAWTYVAAKQRLRHQRGRLRGSRHETEYLPALAQGAGVELGAIERRNSDGRPWTLRHSELVMCPKAFDFPRDVPDWRHYLEPCIDRNQASLTLDGSVIPADPKGRSLIYCALGTRAAAYENGAALLKKVIEAARLSPEWRFILSGGGQSRDGFTGLPENVTVLDYAPQLQILRHASLMITHGGLASVKECIWSGVPMIVFPFSFDQPGNAARVQYHGLGLHGTPQSLSVPQLRHMIRTVLGHPSFLSRVQAMQHVFRRTEEDCPSLRLIEALIDQGTAASEGRGLPAVLPQ